MGSQTFRGHNRPVQSVAFSPSGKYLVSGGGRGQSADLILWDAEGRKEIRTFSGHSENVTAVAFGPSGTRIASASHDCTLRMWETGTGRQLFAFEFPSHVEGYPRPVLDAAFSPDGKRIVCGGSHNLARILDAESGELIVSFGGRRGDIQRMAFNSDGTKVFALVSSISKTEELGVWNATTGEEILVFSVGNVEDAAFSPDDRQFVTGNSNGTITVWDADVGQQRLTINGHSGPGPCCRFQPEWSSDRQRGWDDVISQVKSDYGRHSPGERFAHSKD